VRRWVLQLPSVRLSYKVFVELAQAACVILNNIFALEVAAVAAVAAVDTGYDYCCDCSSDDETLCSDDGLNCDCDYCQFYTFNACSYPDICEGCTGVDTGFDYCCNCEDYDMCDDNGLDCDCNYDFCFFNYGDQDNDGDNQSPAGKMSQIYRTLFKVSNPKKVSTPRYNPTYSKTKSIEKRRKKARPHTCTTL